MVDTPTLWLRPCCSVKQVFSSISRCAGRSQTSHSNWMQTADHLLIRWSLMIETNQRHLHTHTHTCSTQVRHTQVSRLPVGTSPSAINKVSKCQVNIRLMDWLRFTDQSVCVCVQLNGVTSSVSADCRFHHKHFCFMTDQRWAARSVS